MNVILVLVFTILTGPNRDTPDVVMLRHSYPDMATCKELGQSIINEIQERKDFIEGLYAACIQLPSKEL